MIKPKVVETHEETGVFVTMRGPYTQTPEGYGRLYAWIGRRSPRRAGMNGYLPDGPPMERYYSGPVEVPPEEYLTEVLVPVRPA